LNGAQAWINDRAIEICEGETILDAARRLGVEIPTLCYTPGLTPEGGCRLCLVEVNRASRPMGACHTPIKRGMQIATHTEKLESLRRETLALYLEADERGAFQTHSHESEFTRLLALYRVGSRHGVSLHAGTPAFAGVTTGPSIPLGGPQAHGDPRRSEPIDQSHTYLRFDPRLCISCRRCLNACEQIQGQFVYGIAGRGPATHLIFGPSERFDASPCVACGACVDQCPTHALSDRDRWEAKPAERVTQSVCGYCGVGCRVEIESAGERVLRIRGVPGAAVNRGHLCVKGRYAHNYHHADDRLTRPLKRVGKDWLPISWDEALSFAAERLSGIRDRYGPNALGGLASSRSTNEAAYLLQKLFRAVIGTNNVDCCARVCHSSTALALQKVTGTGAASVSFADIEAARCIVLAGANPTEAHPVVGARLKQAVLRGARLILIDPRRVELADYADHHLQVRPGANVALFNALAKVLVEEGLIDSAYLEERTEGFPEYREFLQTLSLEAAATLAGVPSTKIYETARLIGSLRPALFVTGLGLSELTQGTASVVTMANIAMLTGSIGRSGAGMLPLRGQNNVQGAADMGSMPNQVTGYQSLREANVRNRLQQIWGSVPPEEPGITVPEMIDAAARGELRGLWIQGEDIAQSDPNEAHVFMALSKLDFLMVQEMFFSETARYAHLVLPTAGALEQEGTFTNGERRIQRVRAAVRPPGEARPDWSVIRDVAVAMGASWHYQEPAGVMDEIARVAPHLFGGVSYRRLEADGLQWPCPEPGHSGTASVHTEGFVRGKGRLVAIDYAASPEQCSQEYPFVLVTGRVLNHYNVGSMTRRTAQRELVGEDFLEIHPEDAAAKGLAAGDFVELESRRSRTRVRIRLSRRVTPGTLFLAFHFPETHTNRLTSSYTDPESKCPEYKITAVRVRVGR
jgi:formate dehydrogenase alpha subunit